MALVLFIFTEGLFIFSGQYSLLDPTRDKACLGGITDTDQGDDEVTDGWGHAATICTAIGARLCTVAELQADETRCTGCQHDGQSPVESVHRQVSY